MPDDTNERALQTTGSGESSERTLRENEAREFYCMGNPLMEKNWDAYTDAERAEWTRKHDNLLSVRLERFRTSHPIVTWWADMKWVDAFYRSLALPFRTAWKAARRGR